MSAIEKRDRLRKEQDILDRLDNVRRLIQMETTLITAEGATIWNRYCLTDREGKRIGDRSRDLLHEVREEIQMQLLSITALCYGDNPDIGEPVPMLEWKDNSDFCSADKFHDTWEECLQWNA